MHNWGKLCKYEHLDKYIYSWEQPKFILTNLSIPCNKQSEQDNCKLELQDNMNWILLWKGYLTLLWKTTENIFK